MSTAPVAYAEMPHAQHAFDFYGSLRAHFTAGRWSGSCPGCRQVIHNAKVHPTRARWKPAQSSAMRERLRRVRNISLKRLFWRVRCWVCSSRSAWADTWRASRSTSQETRFGDFGNPNRVNVVAWITRVDPAAQVFWMTVIDVNPPARWPIRRQLHRGRDADHQRNRQLAAHHRGWHLLPDIEQHLTLAGTFTDYPSTTTSPASSCGSSTRTAGELPTAVTLYNVDAFFQMSATQGRSPSGGTVITLDLHRSTPTMVFAAFIMVLMLGLAAAAAVAAYYVLNWKRGLVFGACSMMAAILFALIPCAMRFRVVRQSDPSSTSDRSSSPRRSSRSR